MKGGDVGGRNLGHPALDYGTNGPHHEARLSLGKNFRLPLDVRPSRYQAHVDVDMKSDRFEGGLSIDVTLERPRAEIHLHAVGLEIFGANARLPDRSLEARASVDAESETVTLTFAEPLP